MKVTKLVLVAAFVIAADLGVVVLIIGSLWLEQRLGWSPGIILDAMTVVAVSYVAAGWFGEKFLEWEFGQKGISSKQPASTADSAKHERLHAGR